MLVPRMRLALRRTKEPFTAFTRFSALLAQALRLATLMRVKGTQFPSGVQQVNPYPASVMYPHEIFP